MISPTSDRGVSDPGIEALRLIASRRTVHSIKETILACMLIYAVRRPRPGWRTMAVVTSVLTLISVHWHILHHFMHTMASHL